MKNNPLIFLLILCTTMLFMNTACGSGNEANRRPGEPVHVTDVSLNKTTLPLTVGSIETLTATVLPANATDKGTTWLSSNENVATVTGQGVVTITNSGLVRAVAEGSTTITVTTRDGSRTTTCLVRVGSVGTIPVTGITLNKSVTSLLPGDSEKLAETVQPANATNRAVSWSSSDSNIVSVNNSGLLTANAEGRAVITVTTNDGGLKTQCEVTVANLYVAGKNGNFAALWKNKTSYSLSSNFSQANSVFASGNYVYVAGYTINQQGKSVATLWKVDDTTLRIEETKPLSNGSSDAEANAVFVSGSDVYVVGSEHNISRGKTVATLWKNNDTTPLSYVNDGAFGNAGANSVFVSGSNVYVAGYEYAQGKAVATLWDNGTPTRLSYHGDGAFGDANAHSVFVSGSDVYVVGNEYIYSQARTAATLWKNTSTQPRLSNTQNNASANSVFVSKSNVYVAGYESNNTTETAMLWSVGNSTKRLSDSYSQAYSVYVLADNVYVLGVVNGSISIWKNGDIHSDIGSGEARSVFLR